MPYAPIRLFLCKSQTMSSPLCVGGSGGGGQYGGGGGGGGGDYGGYTSFITTLSNVTHICLVAADYDWNCPACGPCTMNCVGGKGGDGGGEKR